MDYSIDILYKEREKIICDLKNGKQERLGSLQDIDKAIGWLELLNRTGVRGAGRYTLDRLPIIEGRGGFCSYRIMMDDEMGNPDNWEEYKKPDGGHYELTGEDDFILAGK